MFTEKIKIKTNNNPNKAIYKPVFLDTASTGLNKV